MDEEVDYLYQQIVLLRRQIAALSPAAPAAPVVPPPARTTISVVTADSTVFISTSIIEIDQAVGLLLSEDAGGAKVSRAAATALPPSVALASVAGIQKEAANRDHTHGTPLTTKGDLLATDGASLARLAAGTNGQVLKADNTQPYGLAWGAAGGGTSLLPAIALLIPPTSFVAPPGLQEYSNNKWFRNKFDLTNATQARLVMALNGVPAVTPSMSLQYSTDDSTWNYADGATGPTLTAGAGGTNVGAWGNLTALAKADVFLRIVTASGDGVTAYPGGTLYVEVK